MDILKAIKREERKLEKQLGKLQHELNGIRAAAKALGDSASREVKAVKKRVLSAAARAKMGKAAKKRWAKFRAQKESHWIVFQSACRRRCHASSVRQLKSPDKPISCRESSLDSLRATFGHRVRIRKSEASISASASI